MEMTDGFDEDAIKQLLKRKMEIIVDDYNNQRFKRIVTSNFLPESLLMLPGKPDVTYPDIENCLKDYFLGETETIDIKIDRMSVTPTQVVMRDHYWLYDSKGRETELGAALVVWVKRGDDWYILYEMSWGEPSPPEGSKQNENHLSRPQHL